MPATDSDGTPAPYGRSCEECYRSKCKCILRPNSSECERCFRLKRECRQHESTSKRRRTGDEQSEPQQSRIARLESKLDQLVDQLQPLITSTGNSNRLSDEAATTAAASESRPMAQGQLPGTENSRSYECIVPGAPGPPNGDKTIAAWLDSRNPPQSYTTTLLASDIWNAAKITQQNSEEMFSLFKSRYLKWFPFVCFPFDMTAQKLCATRPFLWLSIMTTTSQSFPERQRLDHLFREKLGKVMVVEINKSIDLLLGILVFIGWYHLHSEKGNESIKMSLVLLMQMATSMIYDMRKITNSLPHQTLISQLHRLPQFGKKFVSTTIGMEERRAFLGCFLLTSVTTHYLGKGQALQWDSSLQECLEDLDKNSEWYGDDVLTHQVRAQLVIERATILNRYESALEPTVNSRTLSSLHVQALKAELNSIKSTVKEKIADDPLVRLHHHGVELAIVEIAIATSKAGDNTRSLLQESFRFECLRTIKAWFEVFFSLSATELHGMSFYMASQAILALGTLYFITAEPGARREEIRAEMDALATIDRLIQFFQEAINTLDVPRDDVQNRMVYVYRTIRSVWAVELGDPSTESAQRTLMAPTPPSMDDAPLTELFNMELFENGFDWDFTGVGPVMGPIG